MSNDTKAVRVEVEKFMHGRTEFDWYPRSKGYALLGEELLIYDTEGSVIARYGSHEYASVSATEIEEEQAVTELYDPRREWAQEDAAPPRAGLLREAEQLITGDRNVTHGEPTQNFRDIGELWTTLLAHKLAPGQRITSGDTAMLMVALKLARMRAKPTRDHWVDVAGYAACGFETDVSEGRIDTKESGQ